MPFGIPSGNLVNRDKNLLIKYRLQGPKSFAAHRLIKGLHNWVVWTSGEKELKNGPSFKARVAEYGKLALLHKKELLLLNVL